MIEAANSGVERVKKTLTLAQFHEHISVSSWNPPSSPRFSSARGMGVTMDQRRRLMMASKCLDIRLGRLARVDLDPDVAEQQETQPFPPLAPMETLEVSLLEIRCPRLGLGPLGQLSMQSEDRLLLKVQNALSA